MTSTPHLAALEERDLDDVLALNEAHVPHVGSVGVDRLAAIVQDCSLALVARDDREALCGFVLVLGPGAAYDSPNYRWFEERYDEFRYVDRVVVDTSVHRGGLGRRLYTAVFDHARDHGVALVTAEVNVEPPNPVSTAFHTTMGFVEVGRQDTYGGEVTVALMAAPVPPG